MTAKICPKCGCVYADGRSECSDCGEYTRKATDEEIAGFEKSSAKKLKRAAGTHPQTWQYIAAVSLVIYSAGLGALCLYTGFGGIPFIIILNLAYAWELLQPVFDNLTMIYNALIRRKIALQFTYNYTRLMIGLVIIIIMNVTSLTVWLFMENGILVRLMT